MQKVIKLPAPAEAVSGPTTAAPPSMEPILAVVDSLSRTLDCIKTMCATEPTGTIRDRLETERANLVIGLFQHDTNRNQEPNAHFHAVVANVTQGPDGKWRALRNDKLWEHNTLLNAMTMA